MWSKWEQIFGLVKQESGIWVWPVDTTQWIMALTIIWEFRTVWIWAAPILLGLIYLQSCPATTKNRKIMVQEQDIYHDFNIFSIIETSTGTRTFSQTSLPLYQNRDILHQPVKLHSLAEKYAQFGVDFIKRDRKYVLDAVVILLNYFIFVISDAEPLSCCTWPFLISTFHWRMGTNSATHLEVSSQIVWEKWTGWRSNLFRRLELTTLLFGLWVCLSDIF